MGKGNGGTRGSSPASPNGFKAPAKEAYSPPSANKYIRVTDRGMTEEQREKILPFEDKRADAKVEYGMTVDKNGNIVTEKKGRKHVVEWDWDEIPANGVLTHIHPLYEKIASGSRFYASVGSPFSKADIGTAIITNLAEIRARTPNYVFSVQRKGSSWNVTRDEYNKAYSRIYRRKLKEARDYFGASGLTLSEVNQRVGRVNISLFHTTMQEMAKQFGFKYTRTKVR